MSATLLFLLCFAAGEPAEIVALPVDGQETRCFIAQGSMGEADVVLLTGNHLERFPVASPKRRQSIRLDDGTSAFDIADLDGDEIPELVAIQGTAVKRIDYGGGDANAELLFETESLYSATYKPFPQVLVTTYDEETVIALPRRGALTLWRPDGTLVHEVKADSDTPATSSFGPPFVSHATSPPQVAPPGSPEFRVRAVRAEKLALPDALAGGATPVGPSYRYGTQRQTRDVIDQPPHLWPWFPLTPSGSSRDRALYAAEGAGVTVIRIQSAGSAPSVSSTAHAGPPRRYPGQILASAGVFPDFNGDGNTDLLLWDAPEPAPSVSTLTRAIATRNWPLRLSVHLYQPDKRRFAARPASVIQLRCPISWFLEGFGTSPLRQLVLADFDGDGRTDLGCSSEPGQYALWCWGEEGFHDDPDHRYALDHPVRDIAFLANLGGDGYMCLGLRSEAAVYVLRIPPGRD